MGLIEDANNKVIERIRAAPALAQITYVSETTEEDPQPLPLPYIMVFCDNGQYTSEMLTQMSSQMYFNYTIHMVGETFDQVNALGDALYGQLLDWRATGIPGARAFKMIANFSTPDNTNDSVHPPLLYRVDEWGMRLTRG